MRFKVRLVMSKQDGQLTQVSGKQDEQFALCFASGS